MLKTYLFCNWHYRPIPNIINQNFNNFIFGKTELLKSLNFKHIFYFWVVAKEQSIQKASILLNVSPSSISEQIRVLEARVGNNLFDRNQKKMILSSAGKVVFETLDSFFPAIEELFESLANHKHTDVKFLRIGLCPTLSQEIRFKLCYNLIEDPYYTVRIHQGENNYLLKAFNHDEIDLLFSTNNNLVPKGNFKKYSIGTKKFNLVCNKSMYSKLEIKKGFNCLSGQKFINYTSDSELHFQIYDLFHEHEAHPIRVAEIDDINLIKKTIFKLDCFAILPTNSTRDEIETKKLCRIPVNLKKLETQVLAFYKPKFDQERFRTHLKYLKDLV
jgi:LysR family transcriptional activator of nhaA